jgi:probable F420-dependent oxidoreductase
VKVVAQPMVEGGAPALSDSVWLAETARAVEGAGFDALAFEDHPAPPRRWIENGGHQAFDPFLAIAFCAAVTQRIRLMPLLVVAPYRNPVLLAKSIATADVLSEGRLTVCAGVGYLRAEFAALGVDFDQRNARFDEAMDVTRRIWADGPFSYDGASFAATEVVSKPPPVQRPHPPIWIGGNSTLARERAARYGDGWAPLQATPATSRMARTAGIDDDDSLRRGIEDVWRRAELAGRDPTTIDVAVTSLSERPSLDEFEPGNELDRLAALADLGVTWCVVPMPVDGHVDLSAFIVRYGGEVIRRLPDRGRHNGNID